MCWLHAGNLNVFSQEEKKNEVSLVVGTGFLSILFNLVSIQGVNCTTQMSNGIDLCNGTRFRILWKIKIIFIE